MKELQILKAKLEKELETINEALRIQEKYRGNGGFDTPRKPFEADSEDITNVILSINRDFSVRDVHKELENTFAGYDEETHKTPVANTLYKLITEGKLSYVSKRSGRKPAVYCKSTDRKRN